MAKCSICKVKVELTFLQKPLGTYMKNKDKKQKLICSNCQKTHSKEELLEKI